ncbi:MAG: hypothetical protein J5662_08650, partial [Clostridia bacterium]|nr:hypothetical protein [Clostridia bacterium]
MKAKRILSAVLSVVMVLTMFTVLTLTVPVTVSATGTETEDAILIGKGTSMPKGDTTYPMVNIMLPIGAKSAGSGYSDFDGDVYFKLQFKCKMLSGTQPIVGMLRTNYGSGDGTYSEHGWCYNNDVGGSGETNSYSYVMSSYNSSTGTFTAIVRAWYNETNYYRNGRWCYLTIGNAEHNAAWYEARDLDASFIMSQPTLYAYDTSTGETYGDNLAPAFSDSGCDFNGTYFLRSQGAAQYDNPYYASADKWHVDSAPALVNKIKVPTNYNTTSNYDSGNFTKHNATGTQREYYTNANYSDLYFEKVRYSNDAGFKVISDINKKMIIIEANHEGEADVRDVDGYQPTRNKPANIFLPINFGQYSMNGAATVDGNFLIKVSMTAKRLEGDGYPVLGRIVGKKSVGSGAGSQAFGKMAKNLHLSGYYAAGSHETYNGGTFSYDESTGAFVGWMRVRRSDNDYATKWGNNEVITIGNAEHVWQEGTFDTTEFNSSFAITDLKVDVYTCTNPSSGVYTVGSLLAEDVAPALTAENLDTTSNWAYQHTSSSGASNHSGDCIRGNQYKWSVDGNTGMVHNEDITACIANSHELEHHSATETAVEYWGCSTCRKIFADPYGKRQINGSNATFTEKMVCIESTNNRSSAFIPVNLNGFDGGTKQWYKFTCKVKCIGDGEPVVSTLYNKYTGNQCETTQPDSNDGDMAVIESSYDATTQTLTGYIKAWVPTYNKAARYPYIRYNPVSGANVVIVVGNGRYIGNGYTDQAIDTSFAIATPTLHKIDWYGAADTLTSAKEATVLGDNLIAPISDKTVDFSTNWSLTWTDSNNPLSAPMGYWHKLAYDTNNVTCIDIPTGFFESDDVDGDPKMIRLAGANTASGGAAATNQQALNLETHLTASETYQFDLDYRAFGGAEAYINIQTAAEGGSYSSTLVTYNSTASNVDGAHRSV